MIVAAILGFLAVLSVLLAADNIRAQRRLQAAELRYEALLGDFNALLRSID